MQLLLKNIIIRLNTQKTHRLQICPAKWRKKNARKVFRSLVFCSILQYYPYSTMLPHYCVTYQLCSKLLIKSCYLLPLVRELRWDMYVRVLCRKMGWNERKHQESLNTAVSHRFLSCAWVAAYNIWSDILTAMRFLVLRNRYIWVGSEKRWWVFNSQHTSWTINNMTNVIFDWQEIFMVSLPLREQGQYCSHGLLCHGQDSNLHPYLLTLGAMYPVTEILDLKTRK